MRRPLTIGVDPRLMFIAVLLIVYALTDNPLAALIVALIATLVAWALSEFVI